MHGLTTAVCSCCPVLPARQQSSASLMQFNARSETVQEKSVFSRLLSSQRCIFMCEGFYEWKKASVLQI